MECVKTISAPLTKGEDHRRFARQRVKTLAYIDLGSENGGTLIDVSEGGLAFQGIQPLETGQVLPLSFKLPGIHQPFKTTGQIVWLNESGKGGGLQFVELLEHTRNLLKEWLSGASSSDLEEPPVARASLTGTETTRYASALRAAAQQIRSSTEKEKPLVELLHDTSLSQSEIIAAVDASRSTVTAVTPKDSRRAPRFPERIRVTQSTQKTLTIALRILLILSLALVVFLGVTLVQHYRGQAMNASSSAPGSLPLGLEVGRIGEDWQVRWDRNSEVLAKAMSGHLSITDGPVRKELDLDVSELRSGSIMYSPATDDVIVRLQIVTGNSPEPVSESVRMVAGKLP